MTYTYTPTTGSTSTIRLEARMSRGQAFTASVVPSWDRPATTRTYTYTGGK